MGMTCTGKTTIAKELGKYGYERVITYTSRPMRRGEGAKKDYIFIPPDDFDKMEECGFFAESFEYKPGWKYGSALRDYKDSDKKVIILTPNGIRAIRKKYPDINLEVFHLVVPIDTIKQRLLERGDSKREATRRLKADIEDFESVSDIHATLVLSALGTPEAVCESLVSLLENRRRE